MAEVGTWTASMACALQSAANMTNERFAEWLGIATRTVAYWHSRPDTIPGAASQELLHTALDRVTDAVRLRFWKSLDAPASAGIASRGDSVKEAMESAAESVTHDAILNDGRLHSESAESLQEEIALIARSAGMPAFDIFTSSRHVRDEARAMVERTHRPTVLADLYAVLGQATALMASTAFDLGHWNESAVLARASTQYAELAGHASLAAWTLGLRATLANWRGDPDTGLHHFRRGLAIAPAGDPRLRLRYIASRSYALLDDARSVSEVLQAAEDDRDAAGSHADDLSRGIGGEFAFGDARAAACAAAAWLDLRNGEEAARHAQLALDAYNALPAARRPYSQVYGTQIDISAAHLHMHDRDGAHESLQDVLRLPSQKRNVSLSGRLAKVRTLLLAPPWQGDREAQQLAEEIAGWLTDTSARPLD